MKIIESTAFQADVGSCLSSLEIKGLYFLLADDFLIGNPVPRMPGLREMTGYADCTVIYSVSPDLLSIYLLQIYKQKPLSGSKSDENQAKKALSKLVGGGIFAVGKKVTDWFIDQI